MLKREKLNRENINIKMGNLSIYLKESMTKMSSETTLFLN